MDKKAACTLKTEVQAAFCLFIADENRNDTALARLDVLPVRLAARRLVSF